ncbi:MAG: ABC transporter permease [Rhodobacteraceae bacterium]|jgi:peptide/nickel transport system permease protein|nr:ABC transporter permease [Paracoccaceae bacterium]
MSQFILRRIGLMILTALCLTFIVFFLTNLYPNLEKLTKMQGNFRMSDEAVASYLESNGYLEPVPIKYGEWLGIWPGFVGEPDEAGKVIGRCIAPGQSADAADRFCGILQGNWGHSIVFKKPVLEIIKTRLALTGWLMLAVMLVMVPGALVLGVLAGMREGTKLDRSLSTFSIITTATPEYVTGVIFIALFATPTFGMNWFKGTATSAIDDITWANFTLPVLTIALFGMGYMARLTRASMTEVMTAQYIRTARLKGVSFHNIVLKHALRNALITPFTVIMLQIPWLLNGAVIVETMFNYKGFGWTLVKAASNNDIELLLGISVVSVFVVLLTQLISDVGYVYLNPRIQVS